MKRKILSLLLVLALCLSLLPAAALAAPPVIATTIPSIDVTGITAPAYGQVPDLNITLPADAPYRLATEAEMKAVPIDVPSICWMPDGSSDVMTGPLNTGDYVLNVFVTANPGYRFDTDTSATANGQRAGYIYYTPTLGQFQSLPFRVTVPDQSQTYTVKYDYNGSEDMYLYGAPLEDQVAAIGVSFSLSHNNAEDPHMKFICWNTRADGTGTDYQQGQRVENLAAAGETITLYGKWEALPTTYNVVLHHNGGTTPQIGVKQPGPIGVNKDYQIPANPFIAPTGKMFSRWNTKADGTGTDYIPGTTHANLAEAGETCTLYAIWTDAAYTIRFDLNGGTAGQNFVSEQTALCGKDHKLPAGGMTAPTGKSFVCFNTQADGKGRCYYYEETVRDLASVGGTIKLYAIWGTREEASSYTVELKGNGGTYTDATVRTYTVQINETFVIPENPFTAPEDHRFYYWNTRSDNQGKRYLVGDKVQNLARPGETFPLYAIWEPDKFTIQYHGNGGVPAYSPIVSGGKFPVGEPVELWDCPFKRDGYSFDHWNTRPDDTGTYYSENEVVTFSAGKDEQVDLYAIWQGDSFIVLPPDVEITDNNLITDKDGNIHVELQVPSRLPDGPWKMDILQSILKDRYIPFRNKGPATLLHVKLGGHRRVLADIPLTYSGPGVVAMEQLADGSFRPIRYSLPISNGIRVPLSGDTTLRIDDRTTAFSDTRSHWAGDAITFVTAREIFNGVGGNRFAPDSAMTRSMLVQVLYNLEYQPRVSGSGSFADVAAGQWYTDAVRWAAHNHIVKGLDADHFGPGSTVTREQLAVMLYRYAGSPGVSGSLRFRDAETVSDWAEDAMIWAVENGLIEGMGDNLLEPQGLATRAQLAAIMQRFCQLQVW